MTAIQIKPAPVKKSVVVRAPLERAFAVFTSDMGRWWPPGHHIGASAFKEVILEPRVGGRWYELGEDGTQCSWGHVMAWDPPRRLVIAWQLNGEWTFDADLITEVEVTFTPQDDGATRVELEHRSLERMGETAESVRASFDAPGGWGGILERFAKVVEG